MILVYDINDKLLRRYIVLIVYITITIISIVNVLIVNIIVNIVIVIDYI